MKSVGRTYRGKKSQVKKSATPISYYGIKRTIGYFTNGTLKYVDVVPLYDEFNEQPVKQDTCGTTDGRTYTTWFDSKKKRDAILRKIQDAIFIGWDPKSIAEQLP